MKIYCDFYLLGCGGGAGGAEIKHCLKNLLLKFLT